MDGRESRRYKRNEIVIGIAAIMAVSVAAFCIFQLFWKLLEYRKSEDTFDDIRDEAVKVLETETDEEIRDALYINWKAFAGTDVIAWVQLDDISYPVLQGEDNSTYIHTLPDGSYNYGGSIFLYSENSPAFTDSNSFLYGHNMADGSMFGSLKRYEDEAYRDHRFYIYLPDGTRNVYHFYSVACVYDGSKAYTWSFGTEQSYLDYQDYMKKASFYENSPMPDRDAKYVTLSTCYGYAGSDQRFLVVGQFEKKQMLPESGSGGQ